VKTHSYSGEIMIRVFLGLLLLVAFECRSELLKVSADGTVFISTDFLESYSLPNKGKGVKGLVYYKEEGGLLAPFSVTCNKDGGFIAFLEANEKVSKEKKWSTSGKGVLDAIGITACRYAK
jgi:hypothetical protein